MGDVWKFIEKQSTTGLKNQLHAIWYLLIGFLPEWMVTIAIGIAYPWTILGLFHLQSFNSSVRGQGKVDVELFIYLYNTRFIY
jgi:hypothetical protein